MRRGTRSDPGHSVGTLTKAKAVLDALKQLGPSRISEISAYVHEPASSTYRLLSNLVTLGWVDHGLHRGEYRLGIACVRIGGRIEARLDVQSIARHVFKRQEGSNGSWSLFVRYNVRSVCVQMTFLGQSRLRSPQIGYSLPISLGAPSDVLLAFLDQSRFERLIEHYRYNADMGGLLSTFRERSVQMAEKVTKRGYAYDVDQTVPGALTIAAPIFDHSGHIRAAACYSGLSRTNKALVESGADLCEVNRLRQAARQISQGLGYSFDAREGRFDSESEQ
ncbi:IclR family transcriptional regulator [Bifidobacterium asteroides]|uniref:IclR family transcriptional regulator n=1 Tax=Bifidobacterium TaxID=1678 RepID=UPI0020C2B5DE|nr:IclR family transcriptional regulator C-terminal domain-containing protein [Bifidobacterium asteroides]MCP8614151.1 helix-turn-helix domain-containing protein [Bifidobacterium asteroides]MCT6836524.1 helix-turn-helix domain-containing protein [Bifidobacteriales bacterium]